MVDDDVNHGVVQPLHGVINALGVTVMQHQIVHNRHIVRGYDLAMITHHRKTSVRSRVASCQDLIRSRRGSAAHQVPPHGEELIRPADQCVTSVREALVSFDLTHQGDHSLDVGSTRLVHHVSHDQHVQWI